MGQPFFRSTEHHLDLPGERKTCWDRDSSGSARRGHFPLIEAWLPSPEDAKRLVRMWFARKGLNPQAEGFDVEAFVSAREGASQADLLDDLNEWANERIAWILASREEAQPASGFRV